MMALFPRTNVSEVLWNLKDDNFLRCPETLFSFHLTNDEEVHQSLKSSSINQLLLRQIRKILKTCCFQIASAQTKLNNTISSTFITNDMKSDILSPLYKRKCNIDDCDISELLPLEISAHQGHRAFLCYLYNNFSSFFNSRASTYSNTINRLIMSKINLTFIYIFLIPTWEINQLTPG